MAVPRYDLAAVAVYDPVAMNRNATRNVLYALGFREIDSFANLDDLRRAMTTRDFDIVVVEAAKPGDPVCRLMSEVRRNAIGANPFLVCIVTTWIAEGPLVREVLDCGADDLLTRPFSTNMLADRVRTLARGRKDFVVTSEYVGPDRRKDSARPGDAKLIKVANSFKLKAIDGLIGFEAQKAMADAVAESKRIINLERMRRAAFQIGVIAGFVRAQAAGASDDGPVRRADLERIVMAAEDLALLAKGEGADQAWKTCETVIDTAQKSMLGESLESNAQILVRLSVALQVTLSPGRLEEQCEAELEVTLSKIRARGRKG